jgi:hypothetical protein
LASDEKVAETKAQTDAKITADERRRSGEGQRPKERSRTMASVKDAEGQVEAAEDTLKRFDERMRETNQVSMSTGERSLSDMQKVRRAELVADVAAAKGVHEKITTALTNKETSAKTAAKTKADEAELAALREEFSNKPTDYVRAGGAKTREAK